jgi:hypothetical protein
MLPAPGVSLHIDTVKNHRQILKPEKNKNKPATKSKNPKNTNIIHKKYKN